MSQKRSLAANLILASFALSSSCATFADDDFPAPLQRPSGSYTQPVSASAPTPTTTVSTPAFTSVPSDGFRIKRDYKPRLYGTVEKNKNLPFNPSGYATGEPGYDSLVRTNDYASSAAASSSVLQANVTKSPKGTFIWFQSAEGGYYDGSGQSKDIVTGDNLWKYGGHFADGSPTPTFPVVCNFKGHTYRPFVPKRVP